ncbi:hypothetical protein EKK97_12800 [Billgrantia tianxiuensis]|uniref:Uncharacterized protein n=1 Tax=Billgrantia tianxiuensis TaxID=2497861 RepID=A0A6I6SP27_9GAMM|nr:MULTISPECIES: hypothetical protein [Halomonas]MCE8031555.1 hypothetical protein [Halomonas sp. MCCC 1A11057]QHC50286.1 hypothetical protein EKK97_12800 [Halomonas tianxiuensis]
MEKLYKTALEPKANLTPEQKRIEALEQENFKLQQKLSLPKTAFRSTNALSMLDRMINGNKP